MSKTKKEFAADLRAAVKEYNKTGNAKALWQEVERIATELEADR